LFDKKLQGGYTSWEEQEKGRNPSAYAFQTQTKCTTGLRLDTNRLNTSHSQRLEQWKASRHRSLWLVVSNWVMSKWTFYVKIIQIERWFYNYFI